VHDVVIARQQRLGTQVEFGVDLDRLRPVFFLLQDAQVRGKAQTGKRENLGAFGVEHDGVKPLHS
jgi:hypothetical protein